MTTFVNYKFAEAKTNRQSNFELLRILCMILIIAHHYSVVKKGYRVWHGTMYGKMMCDYQYHTKYA